MVHNFITSGKFFVIKNYQYLLQIVLVLCVVASLGYKGMNAFYLIYDTESDSALTISTPVKSMLKTAEFSPLFGLVKGNGQPFVPKTNLNLKLKSILAENRQMMSSAIIQDSSGIDRLYKKGERFASGAVLKEIYKNYVIIEYQGIEQKLVFAENMRNGPLRQSTYLPTTEVSPSGMK